MGFRMKMTPLQPLIPPYHYAACFCLNQFKQSVAVPASSTAPGDGTKQKKSGKWLSVYKVIGIVVSSVQSNYGEHLAIGALKCICCQNINLLHVHKFGAVF